VEGRGGSGYDREKGRGRKRRGVEEKEVWERGMKKARKGDQDFEF